MSAAKKPKLTVKQTKFVDAYIKNDGNGQEAAKAVYDVANDNVARNIASENLTKPNVKEAVQQALEAHGLTIDLVTKPIADGMKAVKLQEIEGKLKALPDHAVRLNASWKALTLMGANSAQDGGSGGGVTFNFGTQNYIKGKE
jgi:isocitrate dehydrogenase